MNKDVEKQKRIVEVLLAHKAEKDVIEVVKACIDLAYLDGKMESLEFGKKVLRRTETEFNTIFYNKAEDGLPKRKAEKSDWD